MVCTLENVCMFICVCLRERDRKTDRQTDKQRSTFLLLVVLQPSFSVMCRSCSKIQVISSAFIFQLVTRIFPTSYFHSRLEYQAQYELCLYPTF